MKRRMFSLGRIVLGLLLLTTLVTCVPPGLQSGTAPAGAVSADDLLANLDALQGSASRSLSATGRSALTTAAGAQIGLADLTTYLNTIKQGMASLVKAHGAPYLVLPVPIPSYPSVAADGTPVNLSGLMWVPFTWGRSLKAPIISFQHGTQVFRPDAPSRFNLNPLSVFSNQDQSGALQNYVECIVGGLMASAGYIVLMPDYPGFGSNTGVHPYVHMSLGNSIRDLIAAVSLQLQGGTVAPNGRIFLTGYSEGGYSTMAGAQAVQNAITAAGVTHAPPFSTASIKAVVPCDGPYDISGVMVQQMVQLNTHVLVPSYIMYTAFGYHSVYPLDFVFSDLFNPPYDALTGTLFDGTHTNADVSAAVSPSVFPATDILSPGALASLTNGTGAAFTDLAKNDSYLSVVDGTSTWVPSAPVFLIHCPVDDVVPYQNAVVASEKLSATITNVPPVPFIAQVMGSNHVAAFPTAMIAAFTRIQAVNSLP